MTSRSIVSAISAATLCASSVSVFAQGRVYDRNASNNPEIYQQTHPEDRSNPQLQGPPIARGAERPADREPRDAGRGDTARRDQDRRDGQRRENDRRQADRRNWDHRAPDRGHGRDYGYVVPRPYFYYGAPPLYYGAPPVYYGGVPQTYYPYANSAPAAFQPGDYLPPEFLSQQYVVQDWQWRGLSAPPYGYHWVLLGPDNYALVADSTGQIVSMVVTR